MCRTIVHWSFLALAEIVATYRFPIVPSNWKTFLVIRQINHTSRMHPLSIHHHPPPFPPHLSPSISLLFLLLSLLFHRPSFLPSFCHRQEGRNRSNRLSHASTDQGWPCRPLPFLDSDFPSEFTSVFTDRRTRAMKPGETREDGAPKIHLTRQDESHPFVAWNDQIGETLTRPFARWPVTRAREKGGG